MIKKDNPWELGQEHIAPDGTKLIVCQPERDGSGCMVCDGCWYLNNKKQCQCPNCRGPFVWIDSSWGVIFRTPEQVKKDSLSTLESEKPTITNDLVAQLKHHLATTPKEQLEAEWKELEPWGNVGPTVEEFLGWQKEESVKPMNQDELEKEIDKYRKEHLFDMPAFQQVARHFAEWGAEHAKK